MPQSRVVPFFGVFLRDLYAIVNDLPNVIIVGHENKIEQLKFLNDVNGDGEFKLNSPININSLDHFSSNIAVGGLLNADKINLVAVVVENIEVFHRHSKQVGQYLQMNQDGLGKFLF